MMAPARRIENLIRNRTTLVGGGGSSYRQLGTHLQMLGKRVERLILIGVVLTLLAFLEMYLTSANYQVSHDRSNAAVAAFLSSIEGKRNYYDQLFNAKRSFTLEKLQQTREHERRVQTTRIKLGLRIRNSKKENSHEVTYSYALNKLINEIVDAKNANPDDLSKFRNPDVSPDKLIEQLHSAIRSIEQQPTTVWGIQTSRLVKVEYAGNSYQVPFGFISMVLVTILSPLIAGWASVLYMTRQREMLEITVTTEFNGIYPHILNFIPVLFQSGPEVSSKARNSAIAFDGLLRIFVVLVLVTPIIGLHSYSSALLLETNGPEYPWVIYLFIAFELYMFFQTLTLLLQEAILLRQKFFVVSRGHLAQ